MGRRALAFNAATGITGVLCAFPGEFLTHLEGAPEVITDLFNRVELDHRHSEITVFARGRANKRLYRDFTMKHVDWDAEITAIFRSFAPGQRLEVRTADPFVAVPLTRAISRTPGWEPGAWYDGADE